MKEIWKDVEGYDGKYQVSNLGNIKTKDYRGKGIERILKKTINNYGYEIVRIGEKNRLVHRVVAEAFIENPSNYPIINHKDETKTNNSVANLEWCDYKYNANYGTAIERRRKHYKRPIFAITKDDDIEFYSCLSEAAIALHVDENCIRRALREGKRSVGRKWDYQDRYL